MPSRRFIYLSASRMTCENIGDGRVRTKTSLNQSSDIVLSRVLILC